MVYTVMLNSASDFVWDLMIMLL